MAVRTATPEVGHEAGAGATVDRNRAPGAHRPQPRREWDVNGVMRLRTIQVIAALTAAVADILKTHPELEQIDLAPFLPEGLNGAMRGKSLSLWTHRHQSDSMFMAAFRKKGK